LAAIWKLPVIFFCENNSYAIHTPQVQSTAIDDIAKRADAYSMPGIIVDGQDILAVHECVLGAVARARMGKGPTLIEAKTYRYCEHWEFNGAMNTPAYRSKEEVDLWRARDPIELFCTWLQRTGTLEGAEIEIIRAGVQAEVEVAVKFADESPLPEPDALCEDVFV
jgi:TPP-dependent pyruvate/acetoin dehydrogenase alpha subunit